MAGIMEKLKNFWTEEDEEADYQYEDEAAEEEEIYSQEKEEPKRAPSRAVSSRREEAPVSVTNNKVVNIHATAQLQVVLSKPERFGDETRAVADELIKMHTVVLNLENTNKDVSRRIIDFLSGVAYANGGKIKRVATSTFIITPYNVDLTGDDVLDELENNGVYF